MGTDPALLTYAVSPSTVEYSGGENALSIVELTITATNGTTSPVACTALTLTVPYDPNKVPIEQNALTHDPGAIVAVPGDETPWAIWGRGDSTWHAVPVPPAGALAPGDQIAFVLSNVIVNQAQGPVTISIDEVAGKQRAGSAGLTKSGEAPAGSAPTITSFTVDHAQIAQGANVTLDWQTANAAGCSLYPGPVSVGPSGPAQVPVHETTTFTLQAVSPGGTATAKVVVTVMPVAITELEATPDTAAPGQAVTLTWATQFAATCAIGPGVGPVPVSGDTVVHPTQTTIYTLTTTGLTPQTKAVTVRVGSA